MAIPATYTETDLATYIQNGVLKDLSSVLGWTTPSDYTEAVNDALLMMDVDDISEVSGRANIMKLRVAAQVAAWRQVVAATTGDYDFAADGGRYTRSQVNEQARAALKLAEDQAMAYGLLANYKVVIDAVSHIHDPYEYVEDDDRVIP